MPVTLNVSIEAFLVHYRILRDFLYPPLVAWTSSKHSDDVIAWDFASSWNQAADDWKECSPNERARLNKLLAHISYSRPQLDHNWPRPEMLAAIRDGFKAFCGKLPDERRAWFSHYNVGV